MKDNTQALCAARAALEAAEQARMEILLRHIANGVLIDSTTVVIEDTVQIAPGARILPGTILRGVHRHRPRLRHRPQQPDRGQPGRRGHHRQRQPGLLLLHRAPQCHRAPSPM